jgi:two-component sensor histidine kinase
MNRYRRLFLLLLGSLILAVSAITWVGWKAIEIQKNSSNKADHQRRQEIGNAIGDTLLLRLKEIQYPALPPGQSETDADPAIAITGIIEGSKLKYPWDPEFLAERVRSFRNSTSEAEFARRIKEATKADINEDYNLAIKLYSAAEQTAADLNQQEFARLNLAGVYMRARRDAEGIALYRALLNSPSDFVEELGGKYRSLTLGIPARELLDRHDPKLDRDVLNRVRRDINSNTALTVGAEDIRGVLEDLGKSSDAQVRAEAGEAVQRLAKRIADLERLRTMPQAKALQAAYPQSLELSPEIWSVFADPEVWLVGVTPVRDGQTPFVAVRAEVIRQRLEHERAQSLQFILGPDPKSVPLSNRIPGLFGVFELPQAPSGNPFGLPALFALALACVGILLPACLWLVWRDTRREMNLAEMRSQFVSSVSHELKTPLTAIRMFAETIELRPDGPKRAQYLKIIVNESERLTRLLNNVLDFSRVERGHKEYHMQSAALADVVHSAARTMEFPLASQGFDFHVEVSGEIPLTPIDRDAMEQAVLNLLSNAMKYSGESRDIALRLCRQNGSALIQVEDHGVGISVDEQKRIFEKFYRVPTAENRAVSGAGLGLALVSHIVEAHGGSVEVESAVGHGSTFTIRVPLSNHPNGEAS